MSDKLISTVAENMARLGFLLLFIHLLKVEGYAHGNFYEAGVIFGFTGVVMGIVGAFLVFALTPLETPSYRDSNYSRRR